MSPPAVGLPAERRSGRGTARRRALRRRRLPLALAVGILVVVVAVVLIPLARRAIDDLTLPLSHAAAIREQAAAKQLDPALVAGVIYAESKFDPRTSPAGAEGLMQIMPETAKFLARVSGGVSFRVSDLGKPQVNIAYGTYLLRYLIDHYNGNVPLALAAYNAGITNVDRWLAKARSRGQTLRIEQIPYAETRLYVERVLQAQQDYRRVYAKQLGY